jgi:imidazoleglycerol-phosphate dehydratase/histidinol-phosphatase
MKKVLFIDRDGTIIEEPEDEQIDSFEKLRFVPGLLTQLPLIRRMTDYEFVLVSNQDGLGTPSFPEETFWPVHRFVLQTLEGVGVRFDDERIDCSMPSDQCATRKPGTGMLSRYMQGEYDLSHSYVIGDRETDEQLARNLGTRCLRLGGDMDWYRIADTLIAGERRSEIHRKTRETDVYVRMNLNGNGDSEISTGLGFFDHMLEQIARHGSIDLTVRVSGDLNVDEHHTIEDTGIVIGECLAEALGDKRGIARYGFCLPMDDCLCQVALDFGGRPWLVWDAEFKRERIGDVPTEMFFHFFKSLSDSARMNLNIKAEGTNEHHKIEGIFKAFARALRMALHRDPTDGKLPSSKGVL